MIQTPDLIQSLAHDLRPVRRLRSPFLRAFGWIGIAAVLMVLLYFGHGLRPAFAERMRDTTFFIGMVSSTLTGVLAAIAAFVVSLPDRSRRWLLLPLPPLVVWLANIGYQCFAEWVALPQGAVTVVAATSCLSTLISISLPMTLSLMFLLSYSVVLNPTPVIAMGSLAVSAMAATALGMFHPLDATVMVLGWNALIAAIAIGVSSVLARRLRGPKMPPQTK